LGAYREEASALLAPRGAALAEESDRIAEGERTLAASQALENAAAEDLGAGDGDVREAAALKLAAGAALDLALANDLLRATPEGTAALGVDEDGSEWDCTYSELRPFLEVSSSLGARSAAPASMPPSEAAALEEREGDSASLLSKAAKEAIAGITQDASAIASHAIDGLTGIPVDAVLSAFGTSADKLLGFVHERISRAVRLALRFVAKAASKLLRVLGPHEPAARKWLLEKLGGVTRDKLVGFVVGAALEVERLHTDVDGMIDAAAQAADPSRVRSGIEELDGLSARFGRHELVVKVLAKVLGKVQGFLIGLASWAAAAVAGVFVLMLAYGIWVAGDFLDWYRTKQDGRLDFVAGVRSIVQLTLGGAASEPVT
jgi:hypothetical protein